MRDPDCRCSLPPNIDAALKRHVDEGLPVGSFTTALLSHELEAVVLADDDVLPALRTLYRHLMCCETSACHGSREIVNAWILAHRKEPV